MATTKITTTATAAAKDTRATDILIKALLAGPVARTYETDSKGRQVRIFTRDLPCSDADIRELCTNARMVHEDEALEIIGKGAMDYNIKVGNFRRCDTFKSNLYITKKMADSYGLPYYMGKNTYR